VYTHHIPPSLANLSQFNQKSNDAPSDIELRGRLQKLRQRLTAAPSVEEIEERLAKLQGMANIPKHHSIGKISVKSNAFCIYLNFLLDKMLLLYQESPEKSKQET